MEEPAIQPAIGMKNWKKPKLKDSVSACLIENVFSMNPATAATEKASMANPIATSVMDNVSKIFTLMQRSLGHVSRLIVHFFLILGYFSRISESAIFAIMALEMRTDLTPKISARSAGF